MVDLLLCLAVVGTGTLLVAWRSMIWMPGSSFRGVVPPLDEPETRVSALLRQDLTQLAETIGERNVSRRYEQLSAAAEFIEQSLRMAGLEPRRQELPAAGRTVWNIEAECAGHGQADEVVIVGAHYDTVPGSPGANDNGSAVVANLALARMFANIAPQRTVRFLFFVNEEFPYYMTDAMGSLRYARRCRAAGERLTGMISLETIGCYLNEPSSQRYPLALLKKLYPTTGNFLAIVGNLPSRRLVHQVVRGFRRVAFPSQGIAAPSWLKDAFRSDHAAFWACGFPALMMTDTANFRYAYYHTPEDTVDKIDFASLARVVSGLRESLLELVQEA